MGGRGALIGFNNNFGESRTKVEDTFEQDKKTNKNTQSIKNLNNINVVTMSSTDDINSEILTPNLNKLYQILSKEKTCLKYLQKERLYIRAERMSNTKTQAVFRNSGIHIQRPEIIFNINLSKRTKDDIEKTAKIQISQNFWTKSDNNELVNHVMVHELGHYIQSVLIEEKYKNLHPDTKYSKVYEAGQMRNEIDSICRREFGKPARTSEYGNRNDREFFAETFCELYTTKNPSYTARALEIYLKEKL